MEHRVAGEQDPLLREPTDHVARGMRGSYRDQLHALLVDPDLEPVGDARALADQVEYLRFVQDLARRGADAGLTPLQAALDARASGELARFEGWHDPERLVGNLIRAYAELDGAAPGSPIDLTAGVAGMVEFNGGQPLRCLAYRGCLA